MLKFFRKAFGLSGDRTAVPDDADPSGNVSYTQGYGFDYQRSKVDPAAKNIERDKMNAILFDVTNAIAELQGQGVPDFITSALNGGAAFSYGQNAVVRYSGDLYVSLVAANTALPSDATKWALLPIPSRLQSALYTRATAGGTVDALTATFAPAISALPAAPNTLSLMVRAGGANTSTTPTFAPDGLAAKTIVKGANQALAAGDIAGAGHWLHLVYDATLDKWVLQNPAKGISPIVAAAFSPVRQTVLAGPVDSNGYPAFGGATGGTSVTASGTLVASAANGFGANGAIDRVGVITAPSWSGLSTNGTMFLYLDIASDGTCTPGSTSLAPVYQFGGAFSTVNGQHTFNTQQMTMQVGNGATASQTYRVFVGEVTISGGVVTDIIWYAICGEYVGPDTVFSASTAYSFSSNLGVAPRVRKVEATCVISESGYLVGDVLDVSPSNLDGAASRGVQSHTRGRNTTRVAMGATMPHVNSASGGIGAVMTSANWKFKVIASRGW